MGIRYVPHGAHGCQHDMFALLCTGQDDALQAARQRATLEQRDPSSCAIKGNVSSSGRIYYVPGARAYASVRMDDIAAGKRWFCSETEAQQAGWRKAR